MISFMEITTRKSFSLANNKTQKLQQTDTNQIVLKLYLNI